MNDSGSQELPSVSVIVPVYNAQASLEDCVESLLALSYAADRLQLLFVDNASTDASPDILRSFGSRIDVLRERKRGPAAARNTGIRSARGEVAAFIDADCRADRGWLANLVAPLRDAEVGICGGKILAEPGANYVARFGERIHSHEAAMKGDVPYAISMSWASRRALLLEVGLFDEDLLRGQDVDLAYRIHQAGYRMVYRPEAITYHRNETSLRGLFFEGYTHGFHGVRLIRKHEAFLVARGHRRVNWKSYRAIAKHWKEWREGRDEEALCNLCFGLGKKFGKICGSARHMYLDL